MEKQESVVDDDEEANDGFLLAFLVAGDGPDGLRRAPLNRFLAHRWLA